MTEQDYCGCCGNEIDNGDSYWCSRCIDHVAHRSGQPWDNSYLAITGQDCPYQVRRLEQPLAQWELDLINGEAEA